MAQMIVIATAKPNPLMVPLFQRMCPVTITGNINTQNRMQAGIKNHRRIARRVFANTLSGNPKGLFGLLDRLGMGRYARLAPSVSTATDFKMRHYPVWRSMVADDPEMIHWQIWPIDESPDWLACLVFRSSAMN